MLQATSTIASQDIRLYTSARWRAEKIPYYIAALIFRFDRHGELSLLFTSSACIRGAIHPGADAW